MLRKPKRSDLRWLAVLAAAYIGAYCALRLSKFLVQRGYLHHSHYVPHRYQRHFDEEYRQHHDIPVIYVVSAQDVGRGRFWKDQQNSERSSMFWTYAYWPLWQVELRLRGLYEYDKDEMWIWE